jgi:hypothetical protein
LIYLNQGFEELAFLCEGLGFGREKQWRNDLYCTLTTWKAATQIGVMGNGEHIATIAGIKALLA